MKFLLLFLTLLLPLHAQENHLESLSPDHPRLILTPDQITRTKEAIASDPIARDWHAKILAEAEELLRAPQITYDLSNKKLLVESRAILKRVTTFAGLYRLGGDERFLHAAKKELLNAASFPDWNPASFLSTAELSNAVGLGYDWIHHKLNPEERQTIRTAIIEKGLKPGLKVHATGKSWTRVKHNWNAVCNGGLTVGALAIADTDPEIANQILTAVKRTLPRGMLDFAPDGGWPEGAGYWAYTTAYNAYSFASLESALGTDFGFPDSPGFHQTGLFRIQSIGNSGFNFNFADAGLRPNPAPQMFWLARLADRPEYDASERIIGEMRPSIFHLIWFNPRFSGKSAAAALAALPPSVRFKGTKTAYLRSGPPEAPTFVGIKGGDSQTNHSHLDLGSFVLDHAGQRFAEELGSDYYTLEGYFGAKRWTYYRLRTEGQNTFTLDEENQSLTAIAEITSFSPDEQNPHALIDLTAAYQGTQKAQRRVTLDPQGAVTLTDEITSKTPVTLTWHLHTLANAELHENTARLTRGGVALVATIVEPPGATFNFAPLKLDPPQRSPGKINKLTLTLSEKITDTTITIKFTPEK